MKFIVLILSILIVTLFILRYLVLSAFFSPYTLNGDVDVWNVSLFVVLVSVAVGVVFALLVYIAEKLLYCGKKEYPIPRRALKFGSVVMVCCSVVLLLHVFHFLNPIVLLLLFLLIVIGVILVR